MKRVGDKGGVCERADDLSEGTQGREALRKKRTCDGENFREPPSYTLFM